MQLVEGRDGKIRLVVFGVLAASERRPAFVDHPDHRQGDASHHDLLANRVVDAEKLVGGIDAQEHRVGGALQVVAVEEAPVEHGHVVDLLGLRRVALKLRALHGAAVGADRGRAHPARCTVVDVLQNRRDGGYVRERGDGHGVVIGKLLASQHLGRRPVGKHRKAKDEQYVRAQRLHQIGHAVVQPGDHRGDDDYGHHADDNAKDRQRAAQLVGTQRVQRHLDCFACAVERHGFLVVRSAG